MTVRTPTSPAGSLLNRRGFAARLAAIGVAGIALPGRLWAYVQQRKITREAVAAAESLSALEFTDAEREMMLEGLEGRLRLFGEIRSREIPNHVPSALRFDPLLPGMEIPSAQEPFRTSLQPRLEVPSNLEELAFLSVGQLAELVRTRRVSSVDLTRMYLDRLKRHGPTLECVVTLTEELAMRQARRADEEIAVGGYRGPLHGIPWGAKDLIAAKGYPTTWGAAPFRDQVIDTDATVVRRLEDAGAVLVAKLTTGELANLDVWFGGMTRNPWNLEQGSGGSSSGPAAATAAGLVAFSLGTDTGGSITHPSARCGTTGMRPSMGRVSRHGVMTLAWSLDKVGPICRTVEDCALVLRAIQGPDGHDLTVREVPFNWNAETRVEGMRVGYWPRAFEEEHPTRTQDLATLEVLRSLGVKLIPVELPNDYPLGAMRQFIIYSEGAAAFDELTRSNRDDLLTSQGKEWWPNAFRQARFTPAVEYIQAQRLRSMLLGDWHGIIRGLDAFVSPWAGPNYNNITVMSGHPVLALPSGFREDGTPVSTAFVGNLYREGEMMAVARAYQEATGFHLRYPPRFRPSTD